MPHPYAGSAGYIYANGRMAAESDPNFRAYRPIDYQDTTPMPNQRNDLQHLSSTKTRNADDRLRHRNRSESDLPAVQNKKWRDRETSDLRFSSESMSNAREAWKRMYKSIKKRFARVREVLDSRRTRIEHARSNRSVYSFRVSWPKRLIPRRRLQHTSLICWESDQW